MVDSQPERIDPQRAARDSQPAGRDSHPDADDPQPAASDSQPDARDSQPRAKDRHPAANASVPAGSDSHRAAGNIQPEAKDIRRAGDDAQRISGLPRSSSLVRPFGTRARSVTHKVPRKRHLWADFLEMLEGLADLPGPKVYAAKNSVRNSRPSQKTESRPKSVVFSASLPLSLRRRVERPHCASRRPARERRCLGPDQYWSRSRNWWAGSNHPWSGRTHGCVGLKFR